MSILVFLFAGLYYIILFSIKVRIDTIRFRTLILFSAYWFISLFLSTLKLFGLNEPSIYTYFLFFLLIGAFTVGTICGDKINLVSDHGDRCMNSIQKLHKDRLFKWILIIASIYICLKVVVFRDVVFMYGNSGIVRSTLSGGGLEEQLYGAEFPYINFFLLPFFLYVSPFFAYKLIHKRDIWCLLSGIYLIGYTVITVSRFGFLRFGLAFVFLEYVLNISKARFKQLLFGVLILMTLMVTAFSLTSGIRQGNLDNVLENGFEEVREALITYSCGPIVAFDYAVENEYVNRIGGIQLGRLSLASFESCIKMTFGRVFPYQTSLERFSFKQNDIINIGENFSWNALYSAAMFFYMDFGIFGLILFPFIFGRIFYFCLKCYSFYPNYSIIVLLFALFRGAIFSVIDYEFTGPIFCILFIFMYIQWKKSRIKNLKQWVN